MFPLRDDNPSHRFPFVVLALVAANAWVFYLEVTGGEAAARWIQAYSIIPRHVCGALRSGSLAPWLTLLTSTFLHGGLLHLVGNLWFLWVFGDNVEDRLGHARFLIFYLGCGICAGLAHVALNPDSLVPTLGASGAISGVLGAYVVLFPRVRIHTLFVIFIFFRVIRLPAILFLGFWFLMQAWGGYAQGALGSGVAFGAHIGGFLVGLFAALVLGFRDGHRPPARV